MHKNGLVHGDRIYEKRVGNMRIESKWTIIATGLGIVCFFILGVFIGFVGGVSTTWKNIGNAGEMIFKDSTWNIDLNETEIVEAVNRTMLPQLLGSNVKGVTNGNKERKDISCPA